MDSLQLHRQLVRHLTMIGVHATQPQSDNLALLCQALAVSPNCHLSKLALGLPLPGRRENLIQRLRRCLKNRRLHPLTCEDQTDYSLFRLGRDYLQRCRTLGRSVPVGFTVQHSA